MKRTFSSTSWLGWSILAILLLSALLLVSWALIGTGNSGQSGADSSQQYVVSSQPETEAAAFQGGWTAWIDKEGKLTKAPPPEAEAIPMDDQTLRRFSTFEADLAPIPIYDEDGAIIAEGLDLQGRFRQGSAATIDKSGEVKIHRIGGEMFLSPDGHEIRHRLHDSDNRSGDNQP